MSWTYDEFMTAIEEWYGPYIGDMKKDVVMKWLMQNVQENMLENLFKRVTTEYSEQFKTPPTHFQFNQVVYGDRTRVMAERAFEQLKGMSSSSSYVFEDVRIQQIIEIMGGVEDFVNRKDGPDAVWARKEFIQKYMDECQYPREIVRKIIYGHTDMSNIRGGSMALVGRYGYRYIGKPERRLEIMQSMKEIPIHKIDTIAESMVSHIQQKTKEIMG